MNYTKVVSVSGVSGAGKTTIVKQLADDFNCPFLLFDEHIDKNTYPKDMKLWLKQGANLSQIKTPRLVSSLGSLISESSSPYIFIEEPFGKERDAMSALINYVVLLDPPMELCLARVLRRHTEQPSSNSINSISKYLDKYEDHFRDIYISAANQVRSNADLIFKEIVSIKATTNYISNWLKNNAKQ
jgi:uridine kinase